MYIGSTVDFEIRRSEHLGQLRANKHCNRFLQKDFNEFKEFNFVFEVISDCFQTKDSMLIREYELILKNQGKCYNIHTDCPVVSGFHKKSKSPKRGRKLIYATVNMKRKKKPKPGVKIKTQHPSLDLIAKKKSEREGRRRSLMENSLLKQII